MQHKTVLSLTIDLLANNAFGHLRDDKISALHHLIIKLQEPPAALKQLAMRQAGLLLTFWNHACTTSLPALLLHQCNGVLQQLGRGPLEMQVIEDACYE